MTAHYIEAYDERGNGIGQPDVLDVKYTDFVTFEVTLGQIDANEMPFKLFIQDDPEREGRYYTHLRTEYDHDGQPTRTLYAGQYTSLLAIVTK